MEIPVDQLESAGALLRRLEDRVKPDVRDKLKLCHRQEGNALLLFEFRPSFMDPEVWHEHFIAKFVYIQSRKRWKLFWLRSDLKWHSYEPLPEAATFARLFREVENDPLCCFFG